MLKFLDQQSASQRKDTIQKWLGAELVDAKPLFAESDDPNLSALYRISVQAETDLNEAVEKLNCQASVDYAHVPQQRSNKLPKR
jgi:hypothetical protein